MLTDEELVTLIRTEINQAAGTDDDEVSANRKRALDYFFARPRGDEIQGNSQVISTDVSDMTEAVLAQMMPAYSTDTLVEFEADSDEDIRQAQTESDVVNNMIMERNRGYWMLSESIKDALLLRNGLIHVSVLEDERVESRVFTGVDEATIAAYLGQLDSNVEGDITSIEEDTDQFGRTALTATIKLVTTSRELMVESVDPTTFITSSNHDSIFFDKLRFCAKRSYPTRSDLVTAGYAKSIVQDLPASIHDDKADTQARTDDEEIDAKGSQSDPAMEVVEQYDSWFRVDRDEDMIAELHHTVTVGTVLLEDNIVDFIPFAAGSAFVNPHQYEGISLFDKLEQTQDIKTKTLRQWLDNVDANNHLTTIAVDDMVEMDTVTAKRIGKVIVADSIEAVRELPMQDLGRSSEALLNYADKGRSEAGGAALALQAEGMQLAGWQAEATVERQMSVMEQLAAMMTRNMSESLIRTTYLLVHQTMRLLMPGEITTRIGGQFVTVDPGQWPARDRVNVKTGLSAGERTQKKQILSAVLAKQTELFGGGMDGVLVDLQGYHNALKDWSRASDIDNPERYWLDPESEESQQAQQGKQQANQAASDEEKALNDLIFGMEHKLEAMKLNLEDSQEQNELMFKYFDAQLKAEVKEAEIVGKATVELSKQQEQGRVRAVE